MIAQIKRRLRDLQVLLKVNDLLRPLHRLRPNLRLTPPFLLHSIQFRAKRDLSRLQKERLEDAGRRDDRQRRHQSRHFQVHLHRLPQNHPHARQQHGHELSVPDLGVSAGESVPIALEEREFVLDVAVNQRGAERRVLGEKAVDLRQRRAELLCEARQKGERRRRRARGRGREGGEEGFEDDGVLGAEQRVEQLHGGDGDGGGVAVDALEQSREEDGLLGGLAAEEADEELDEGGRRRGEKEREEKTGDPSAGDDSLVSASERSR